jgi:hypothetical protein
MDMRLSRIYSSYFPSSPSSADEGLSPLELRLFSSDDGTVFGI